VIYVHARLVRHVLNKQVNNVILQNETMPALSHS